MPKKPMSKKEMAALTQDLALRSELLAQKLVELEELIKALTPIEEEPNANEPE